MGNCILREACSFTEVSWLFLKLQVRISCHWCVIYYSKLIIFIRLPVDDAGCLLAGGAVVYVLTSSVWAATAETTNVKRLHTWKQFDWTEPWMLMAVTRLVFNFCCSVLIGNDLNKILCRHTVHALFVIIRLSKPLWYIYDCFNH